MNDIISLSPPAKKESAYLMADYVEMLCLASQDGEISIDEAISSVYQSVEHEAGHEAAIIDDPDSDIHVSQLNDTHLSKGEDWFRHLSYRQRAFNSIYPFCVTEDTLKLKYDIAPVNALYIFLLVCSELSVIASLRKRNRLTIFFETVSSNAFSRFLPSFTVHHFGKTPNKSSEYPNKLKDAIGQLCKNIHEKPIFDRNDFSDKDTGDGGLDLLAFKLFGDGQPGNMICFAQCACGPDNWIKKQHESNRSNLSKRIAFIHPPANYIFTPVCFRKPDGKWFKRDKISESILVDRLRICQTLHDTDNFDLYESVQAFLDFEE